MNADERGFSQMVLLFSGATVSRAKPTKPQQYLRSSAFICVHPRSSAFICVHLRASAFRGFVCAKAFANERD
jgi:hypothetical protein